MVSTFFYPVLSEYKLCLFYLCTCVLTDCVSRAFQGASRHAESDQIRVDAVIAGRECGSAYANMVELVINVSSTARTFAVSLQGNSLMTVPFRVPQVVQKPTNDKKQKLSAMSKTVADSVGNLVKRAEALKGTYTLSRTLL